MNRVGFGTTYSSEVTIKADEVPIRMNTPTASTISPKSITIAWSAITADADTGRDSVIYYQLQHRQTSSDSWTILNTNTAVLITTFSHVSATVYPQNFNFEYKVCAQNQVGMGACSSTLIVLTDETPTFMNTPTVTNANINPRWIKIDWAALGTTQDSQRGRDPIIFYDIQWDNGGTKGFPNETWISL